MTVQQLKTIVGLFNKLIVHMLQKAWCHVTLRNSFGKEFAGVSATSTTLAPHYL